MLPASSRWWPPWALRSHRSRRGCFRATRGPSSCSSTPLDWRIVLLPGGLDPDEFVRQHGAEAFAKALASGQDLVEFFLDQRVSGLDLKDTVQRARATERLVEVVALIDNPIRREGYLQRTAQRTGMPDRVLAEAVGRQRGRAGRQDAVAPAAPASATPPSAEEQLLFIGLSYPEWRERIAAGLTEFVLRAAADAGHRPTSLLPPEVERRLASLWVRDPRQSGEEGPVETTEATLTRIVEDCLAWIAQRRRKVVQQSRQQALQAAGRTGDIEHTMALLREHPSVKSGRNETQEKG